MLPEHWPQALRPSRSSAGGVPSCHLAFAASALLLLSLPGLVAQRLLIVTASQWKNEFLLDEGRASWWGNASVFVSMDGGPTDVAPMTLPQSTPTQVWVKSRNIAGGNNAADGRVAMAPAWANVTFAGAYDFMLVADDEAVWDLSNVRALLSRLDPAEPLFLTDAAAPHPSHPHRFCVRPPAAAVVDAGARHGVPGGGPCTLYPSAAPCTVAALANRSLSPPPCLTKGVVNGWNTYAHGNAGFIASRGLLASVPPADWARCVDAARPRAGCDVIVGVCVVTLAGHGATRPHRDTRAHVFGGLPPGRWAQLARSLAAGDGAACGRPCRWLLTHSLSTFLPHDTRPNMAALLREWAGATAAARAVLGESPAGEAWDEPVW